MSETTLELKIVSESKSAISSLNELISTLGRVKTAVQNGMNFNTSGNSFKEFSTKMATAMKPMATVPAVLLKS